MKIPFRLRSIGGLIFLAGSILVGGHAGAEDLGLIRVESTTIDDRFEQKRDEPSNIAVISGDEVDAAHTENIQQLLQSIPGITTEVQSGDSLKIHIRGIENQVYMGEKPGVAVVIDGVPVFERTGRVNIDLDNIESIKVVKGGASYLFGDDALSGAVIITTKRGAKYKGFTMAGERGSFDASKTLVRAGFAEESVAGHVQVSRRSTDGYYDDSASEAEYVNGKLQYYIDDVSDVSFGFERSDRKKNSHGAVTGVVAAENDPESTDIFSYNDYANHYDVDLAKYFVTYSRDMNETDNLLVSIYSFRDDTLYLSKPNRDDPALYEVFNDYEQVQNGLKSEYRSSGDGVAWMAAVDLRRNRYKNNTYNNIDIADNPWTPWVDETAVAGDAISDDTTDESVNAVYGELKFQVSEPLVMTINGRVDQIDMDYSSNLSALELDKSFTVSSWRLGGNYKVAQNKDVYANISTGFRAPSINQLFAGDISPTGTTDSNPDLRPEKAVNMEIGYRTKTSLFGAPSDIDVAIFQIDRKDYIMTTAGQYAVADGVNTMYDNIGGVRNRGLELSIDSQVSAAWNWNLAYTYLDAKFTKYDNFNLLLGNRYGEECTVDPGFDPSTEYCLEHYNNEGNVVPRTPKHHVNFAASYRPSSYWTVTAEMDAKSSYYADEINRVKIAGHETFNLLVNYDRKFGDSMWSFFARVDNIFDERYFNTARGGTGDSKTVDSNADGIYDTYDGIYDANDISIVVNPGRVYTAGVSVKF
ncbi:MAG: TonB-dependent receptor PqqU [Thiohalomonadaceae bacterium]